MTCKKSFNNIKKICLSIQSFLRYGVDFAGTKVVVLACASPQKFPEVFQELGVPFEQEKSIKELLTKEKHIKRLREGEDWITAVKTGIIEATKKFKDNKMN